MKEYGNSKGTQQSALKRNIINEKIALIIK
jgi:hypothetical protein